MSSVRKCERAAMGVVLMGQAFPRVRATFLNTCCTRSSKALTILASLPFVSNLEGCIADWRGSVVIWIHRLSALCMLCHSIYPLLLP